MSSAAPFDSSIPSLGCDDLTGAVSRHTREHGYRLVAIFPADDPREALLVRGGERLRLARATPPAPRVPGEWVAGRAGMRYRDLVPDRLGGQVIVSHIQIADAGPVPDYVHHHDVGFQIIHCWRGWVRVVYQDQGPPFVLTAGDCVLQPPGIRHRVLECSAGLEVIEVSAPAEHVTFVDHELELPNGAAAPGRRYGLGQGFARGHAAIAAATGGSAEAHLGATLAPPPARPDGWHVGVVLAGSAVLASGRQLAVGEAVAARAGAPAAIAHGSEDLVVFSVAAATAAPRSAS